jgi:S-adenosylmethionine hydrolase
VLAPVSRTFHGRDVFAPAAAHLAAGMKLSDVGPAVDVATLVRLDVPGPMVADGTVGARVTATDGYGNVQLNATELDLDAAGVTTENVLVVNGRRLPRAGTFAELPEREPGLIVDSEGYLAIVVNHGNAAQMLGLAPGDTVIIE